MKTLRQLFGASILILTFALSALAGEMSTPLTSPQAAPTSSTTEGQIEIGLAGDISTTNSVQATAGDSLTGAALSVLQDVLSLF
ncbi:MAG: hypothetical protein QOJ76_2282 [Acidobacteriota bacterium]|nr:hypothetical protein [Acidobacteriota bacterium]